MPSSYLKRVAKNLSLPPPAAAKLPAKSPPVERRQLPKSSKNSVLCRSTSEDSLKKSQAKVSPIRSQQRVHSPPASKPSSSWMTKSTPLLLPQESPRKPPSLSPQPRRKTGKTHTPVGRSSSSDDHNRRKPHLAPRPQNSVATLNVPKPHTRSTSVGDTHPEGSREGGGGSQPVSELARILQKKQATSSAGASGVKPTSPRATPKIATPKSTTSSPSARRLDLSVKQPPQRPKPYSSSAAAKRAPPKRPDLPKATGISQTKKSAPPRPSTSPGQSRKTSISYTVVCEYGGGDGQVRLKRGQKVEVLEKNSDGWWYVKAGSEEGWAPSSFLEEGRAKPERPGNGPPRPKIEHPIAGSNKPTPASRPVPKPRRNTHIANTYRAAASYQVPVYEDSGMELVAGRTYEVLEKQEGWWFVSDGHNEGWVPSSYLDPA